MGGFRRPGRGGVVSTPMVAIRVIRRGGGGCNPTPLLEQIRDLAIWDRRDFPFSQGDFFHKRLEISGEIFSFLSWMVFDPGSMRLLVFFRF
jgi:hypothetical protein